MVSRRGCPIAAAHPRLRASASRSRSCASTSTRPCSSSLLSRNMLFLADGTPARAASDGPTEAAVVMLSKKKSPRDLSAAMTTRICARSAVNAEPMWLLTPTA